MNRLWTGHIVSFILVSIVLLSLFTFFNNRQKEIKNLQNSRVEKWLKLDYLDFDDPLQKAILEESLNLFDPSAVKENEKQISQIEKYRNQQVLEAVKADQSGAVSLDQISNLLTMYFKFIVVYLITLILTFYGVQTLGSYKFIKEKQNPESALVKLKNVFQTPPAQHTFPAYLKMLSKSGFIILKVIAKGLVYMVLFSPAYVLAYSFRTRFDTETVFFMILLGIISNALLITYSQKFYTFLKSESRKGYVETAIVKNMDNDYHFISPKGLNQISVFLWRKTFPGHVFNHIYENAHFQYLSAIKEQASFLITGLIIIEMALNIQNHLCYELLQNLLYRNYAYVTLIVLGIYYIVKTTNIAVDWYVQKASHKYYNLP